MSTLSYELEYDSLDSYCSRSYDSDVSVSYMCAAEYGALFPELSSSIESEVTLKRLHLATTK